VNRKIKISLYSIILVISVLVYLASLVFFAKQQIILQVIMTTSLIFLGLLFIELYKVVEEISGSIMTKRIFFYGFIILFIVLFVTRFEYLPARTFIVEDVFGEPLNGISVCVIERHSLEEHGGAELSRSKQYCETTNTEGKAHIKPKIYFAEEKIMDLIVYVNYDKDYYFFTGGGVYSKSESREGISNFGREGLTIDNKYKITENFYLPLLKIDTQRCLPLENPMKSICLKNNIFYSAVVKKDSSICENYNLVQIPRGSNEGLWELNKRTLKNECYEISAILNNDVTNCFKIEQPEGTAFRSACLLDLGREDLCISEYDKFEGSATWCKNKNIQNSYTISKYGIGITENISVYLCTDLMFNSDSAVKSYRSLFC